MSPTTAPDHGIRADPETLVHWPATIEDQDGWMHGRDD
jgi:hypothetical protein